MTGQEQRTGKAERCEMNEDKAELFWSLWGLLATGHTDWPEREYGFAPPRRWRFDFAFVGQMVAVEVDGGQYASHGGRHMRDSDRDKLNHAAAFGWRVLRFSPQQLERDPAGCIELVLAAIMPKFTTAASTEWVKV